jgi:hypothetical protein
MKMTEVQEIVHAEVVSADPSLDMEVELGCGSDLMSHVLAFVAHDNALLLTGLTTPQVVYVSDAVNIKAICFVRGKIPEEETVELARERHIVLLATKLPMFEACGRLYKAGLVGCSEYEKQQ